MLHTMYVSPVTYESRKHIVSDQSKPALPYDMIQNKLA